MKKIALSMIMILILVSCNDNKNAQKFVDKAKPNKKREFHYKDLMLDIKNANDTIQPKNITEMFGIWKLDSIAEIGGTISDEKLIQSQIGHQLLINDSIISLPFLTGTIKIDKPNYLLVKEKNSKGSSLYYGYKDGRENVTFLKAHESYYFEIVNFHELAYYYDGRIYFFKRKE